MTQEVQYARIVHLIGTDRARELLNLHPGRPRLEPDGTLDLGIIDQNRSGRTRRRVPRFVSYPRTWHLNTGARTARPPIIAR